MGDTGSPYNFPFPELTDTPDVPQDIEDLALAVHADLATIEAGIAAKKIAVHAVDGGFPVAGSSTGEVDVISRVTVSSVSHARKLIILGSVFNANTQTASNEITLYAGATLKAAAQEDVQATKGTQTTIIAAHDLAASTSVVIELRFQRISGTGIGSTSGGNYTQLIVASIQV
jgi:hypothetical protein